MASNILELERDKQVYRKLRRHMNLDERISLMDFRGDYKRYQKTLFRMARKYKIPVPEV